MERKSILVVDDEKSLLSTLQLILKDSYTVLIARDGKEALQILEQPDNHISLLLTDETMPQMNGSEMCKELKKLNINIPTILMSAIPPSPMPAEIDAFIEKPFCIKELKIKMAELLNEK